MDPATRHIEAEAKERDAEELKKKVTISTKSNKNFLTVMTLDEVHKMKKSIEGTPDNIFVNLWSFMEERDEGNSSELNVRVREIDFIAVEDVSNITLPPGKRIQIAPFTGMPAG